MLKIFRFIFDDDDLVITEEMNSNDIEEWDSLVHISLISEIEAQFGIKFTTNEITSMKNIGDILKYISEKTN